MSLAIVNVYHRDADTITSGETVLVAAERMRQRTVGSLIVVDRAGKPIGIVTDRDLVIRVLADNRDPSGTAVVEIMTPDVVAINSDASVESALQLMRDGTFRRLPVVDHRGILVGIVTLDDLLLHLTHELSLAGHVLEQETPRAAAC
ncbi:MAG: CBS domain-containing protein [Pirellulales bacterium]